MSSIIIIQLILLLFLLFALSRVFLRFRGGQIKYKEFIFWSVVFVSAIFGVLFPGETTRLARLFGIGRGADLVIYVSIIVLFYLIFRAYVLMENLSHQITELVRKIALENGNKANKPK